MKKFSKKKWTEFFHFLDALRESGLTNMYGASPYVQNAFKVDHETAVNITVAWMKTFSRETSPEVRADEYLASLEKV